MTEKLGRKYELTIFPAQYLKTDPDGITFYFVPLLLAPIGIFNTGIVATVAGVASGIERELAGVEIQEDVIQITNPLTLEFNIRRKALASANTATFRIYNLKEETRNALYKDYTNYLCLRRIVLKAGYSEPLPIIFDGNIKWSTSSRMQGQTNFITEIEAFDWSFAMINSQSTIGSENGFSGEVKKQQVVDHLVNDMIQMGPKEKDSRIRKGAIHKYGDELTYFNPVKSANTWDLLKEETEGSCFIDSGRLSILDDDECLEGGGQILDSTSGLLGAPKRSETWVLAEMLFEPTVQIGQLIKLNSQSQKIFNASYKIVGINHYGTISDAVGGKCQTNLSLFSFKKNAKLVRSVS